MNRDMTRVRPVSSKVGAQQKAAERTASACRLLVATVLLSLFPAQAWSQQAAADVLNTLALPFADIPESPDDSLEQTPAPVGGFTTGAETGEQESTYHIGVSYTPESGGFGVHADAWEVQTDAVSLSGLTPSLMLDPSLATNEEGARLSDVNHDAFLNISGSPGRQSRGVDLTASYVWESSRFGQFIVSTRATYVYNQQNLDGLTDSGRLTATEHPVLGQVPELQSSLMLSWQSGNHQATATTHVAADGFGNDGRMNLEQLDELVGHITTLDLRYGYNINSGPRSNTRISVGLRNTLDKRPLQQLRVGGDSGGVLDANGSVAYGTIKYQF